MPDFIALPYICFTSFVFGVEGYTIYGIVRYIKLSQIFLLLQVKKKLNLIFHLVSLADQTSVIDDMIVVSIYVDFFVFFVCIQSKPD